MSESAQGVVAVVMGFAWIVLWFTLFAGAVLSVMDIEPIICLLGVTVSWFGLKMILYITALGRG